MAQHFGGGKIAHKNVVGLPQNELVSASRLYLKNMKETAHRYHKFITQVFQWTCDLVLEVVISLSL